MCGAQLMTVYIDNAMRKWRGRHWCHLLAIPPDDPELHEIASQIGLKHEWFQSDSSYPHYDVVFNRVERAIKAGAIPIGWKELGKKRIDYRRNL